MATNLTILEGRLTRDVKFDTTPNGIPVATFTLAVQQNFKDKNGERQADFIRVVAYRKLAELFSTYTKKGSHVNVVGRLICRKYADKNGEVRYITEVIAEQLSLLGSLNQKAVTPKKEIQVPQEVPLFAGQTTQINPEFYPPEPPMIDEDCPF